MSECCGGGNRLIFACSGCSNVGEVADRVVRLLNKKGFGKMSCLAGIGANLSGFVESAKNANENIVVNGCNILCASKIFERIGVTHKAYILTEMGLIKGKTCITDRLIQSICSIIQGQEKENISCYETKNSNNGCCCG